MKIVQSFCSGHKDCLKDRAFEDENNIYDVPMIIVDGKVWPNTYRIEDMIHNIYFI